MRPEERHVDSRFQVKLEEDGGGRTGQSWMSEVVCDLCSTGSNK